MLTVSKDFFIKYRTGKKVQLLKFESDLNAEKDARRMAENAAEAANSVAQNLLRESHRYITRGLDS